MDLLQIIFEVDYKPIVDGSFSKSKGVSEFYIVFAHCQSILCNSQNSRMKIVKRQANQVIDYLNRASRFQVGRHIYDGITICIYSIVINEMK
ncbi:hypothetical protein JHK85_004070 [Glycine max]|nr:hypothetical protein JHK87_003766 [Glycine soja]KAG5062887.1 hypothetical protein JHK85_004070 [Glycine max]KAG5079832.1 hypothetical protein JHK86_003897 [Glycine max]